MANQVRIGVSAPGARQASSDVDRLRDRFSKLQSQGAKGLAIGAGIAVATKAFNLVGSAIGDVTDFLGDSVTAYQEQEVATTRLNQSLEANVAGWRENESAIRAVDEAGVQLGFDNTDTENALAGLVAATHDYGEALQVLAVAQDLARFKGISLTDAAEALTKVEAGSFRILKSLGIQLRDGATQTEALAAVEKVAGGQAREYAETDLGQLAEASAKTQDAQEKLGESMSHLEAAILPAVADGFANVVDALTGFQDAVDDVTTGVQTQTAADNVEGLTTSVAALETSLKQLEDVEGVPGMIYAAFGNKSGERQALEAALKSAQDGLEGIRMRAGYAAKIAGITATEFRGLASDTTDLGQAASGTERPTETLSELLSDLGTDAEHADSAIGDLADTIAGDLFGRAIRVGEIASARKELHDLLDDEPVHEQSQAWRIWAGDVAQAKRDLFELQFQQRQEQGPKAMLRWLDNQEDKLGDQDADLRRLIEKWKDYYRTLAKAPSNVNVTITEGVAGHHVGKRASGGPVQKGQPYIVGEEHEEVFIPNESGHIDPRRPVYGGGGGSSNVSMTVNMYLPNAYGMTPGQAHELARAIGPVILRDLQRGNHVARAGAFG